MKITENHDMSKITTMLYTQTKWEYAIGEKPQTTPSTESFQVPWQSKALSLRALEGVEDDCSTHTPDQETWPRDVEDDCLKLIEPAGSPMDLLEHVSATVWTPMLVCEHCAVQAQKLGDTLQDSRRNCNRHCCM